MNLHQFRFVQEAARRNLNLTETARALHTSQPGISKAILEQQYEDVHAQFFFQLDDGLRDTGLRGVQGLGRLR